MKKLAYSFILLPLGAAFIFLGEVLAPRADLLFHPAEILLARSSQLCQDGSLDACEGALKDIILRGHNSPKLRSLAFYNLGSIALEKAHQGDPAAVNDALFYFKEALRNDPLLFPAKHNLELLLRTSQRKDEKEGQNRGSSSRNSQSSGEGEKEKMKSGLTTRPPYLGTNP